LKAGDIEALIPSRNTVELKGSKTMAQTKLVAPPEPKPANTGQIREVPVRADVLKRSAAQELANPPRFPILK
jgi:hypothetical protein